MKPRFQAIQPGDQESFVVFRRAANEGFAFNWHRHPELELTLIERGRGRRFVGDHIGDYEAGDLVLLGSNLPHTWLSETGTDHLQDLAGSEIPWNSDDFPQRGQTISAGTQRGQTISAGIAGTRSDHLQNRDRPSREQVRPSPEHNRDRPSTIRDRPSREQVRPSHEHNRDRPSPEQVRPSPDCAIVAQFRTDFMGSDFLERPEMLELLQLFERASGGLLFSEAKNVPELRAGMTALLAANGLARVVALLDLLTKLAATPHARVLSSPAYTAATISELADDRIARVCKFIVAQIDQGNPGSRASHINPEPPAELSLARAATEAGMAPASFSRFFKRATGRTFISYVNELRIGRACRLLLETDLTITEIAYRVGFNNLSNFNRRFRRIRGQAPRDYRLEWRAR